MNTSCKVPRLRVDASAISRVTLVLTAHFWTTSQCYELVVPQHHDAANQYESAHGLQAEEQGKAGVDDEQETGAGCMRGQLQER